MPVSLVEGNSLLALDIGSVTTRAAYFDVVEGQYRFIGLGQSPTTLEAPARNIAFGVQAAIEALQTAIGRQLVDENGQLVLPSQPNGTGVDSLCATVSAGEVLKTVLVGLPMYL
jgi:ribulose kinase